MQTTRATRRQFYIAMDMGCGKATAYGACGFVMAVSRLDKPVTLSDGRTMRYSVASHTQHWLTPSARGALNIVARCFTENAPIWRPFIPDNAPEPATAEPTRQYIFADGTQAQRIACAIRAGDTATAHTQIDSDTWDITRDAPRHYTVTRHCYTMGEWQKMAVSGVPSIRAAIALIEPLYDCERYAAIWHAY